MKRSLTYKQSGVSIDEGEKLVRFIKPLAKATYTKGVVAGVGGFGAPFSLKFKKLKDPILVSGTDGVGTKLKVAFMADRHDSIGIDLVAMCVNDIVVTGAEPLFFLDYFATGRLDPDRQAAVVAGGAHSRRPAGDAVIGLASTGLDSNGYSLARKVFFGLLKLNPDTKIPKLGKPVAEELLT